MSRAITANKITLYVIQHSKLDVFARSISYRSVIFNALRFSQLYCR